MGDVIIVRFADCHFDVNVFLPLGGGNLIAEECRDITWDVSSSFHLNPCTRQCELKIQMIIHFQGLANQLPDVFTDTKKVTKSHIPIMNTLAHIDVLVEQLENVMASESNTSLKCGI